MKIFIHKNTALATGLSILSSSVLAQDAAKTIQPGTNFWTSFPHYLEDPLFWLSLMMIVLIGTTVFSLYQSIHALHGKKITVEEEKVSDSKVKKESPWQKIMKGLTKSVPVEQERDVLLDHNYDGIRELDNKLPPWWVWGFYFTIAFAVVYLLSYHVAGTGKLSAEEYDDQVQQAKMELEARMKSSAGYITFENVTALKEAGDLNAGKETFIKLCAACHGNLGQGMVGPNLTDQFWLHGGGIHNIFHTITEGVPAKGMISWKSQLSPKQIQEVSSFILTLDGTNPPGAKEPQGDKWIDETNAVKDTAAVSTKKS